MLPFGYIRRTTFADYITACQFAQRVALAGIEAERNLIIDNIESWTVVYYPKNGDDIRTAQQIIQTLL